MAVSNITGVCPIYLVPMGSIFYIDPTSQQNTTLELKYLGTYSPACEFNPYNVLELDMLTRSSVPFYGSITPIAYTISATTVVAWCLFILLFIAQKPRPWLQKLAASIVAVTLTIALNHTVVELERQYDDGYNDAGVLRDKVFGALYYRILDVISRLVLWFAHLQVILRVSNKPKRRSIIMGVSIVLIIINTVLWCIVSFKSPYSIYIYSFSDALHYITYIFETILFAIYAFVIIFYSIRKRAYAYNKDVIPIAITAISSLLIPLVFFILDACQYWIAGWSDFIRLVGDIAAVIVVWEWLEVIHYMIRKREKRSVLGRQIYEGDMIKFISDGTGHGSASKLSIRQKLILTFKTLFSGHDNWTFSKTKPSNSIPLVNLGGGDLNGPGHNNNDNQISLGDPSNSDIGDHIEGDISRPLYRLFDGLNASIGQDITQRRNQGMANPPTAVLSSTGTTSTSYQVINSQNNNIIFDDQALDNPDGPSLIPNNQGDNNHSYPSVPTLNTGIHHNCSTLPVRFSENTRFTSATSLIENNHNPNSRNNNFPVRSIPEYTVNNVPNSTTNHSPRGNTESGSQSQHPQQQQQDNMSYYDSDDDEIFTVVQRQGFNPDMCGDEQFAAPAYSTEIQPPPPQVFERINGFAEGDYHDDKPPFGSGPFGSGPSGSGPSRSGPPES